MSKNEDPTELGAPAIGPYDDREVLSRAIDIAAPIVQADLNIPDIGARLTAADADPLRVLAHAFWSTTDWLCEYQKPRGDVPTVFRCGWCVKAAGDTRDAWEAVPAMPSDAMKAHTLICDHNPLVVATREVIIVADNWHGSPGPLDGALEKLRALVSPIAPGSAATAPTRP